MTIYEKSLSGAAQQGAGLAAAIGEGVLDLGRALARRWTEARAIGHLHQMTDDQLRDIGLSRFDIEFAVRGLPLLTDRARR